MYTRSWGSPHTGCRQSEPPGLDNAAPCDYGEGTERITLWFSEQRREKYIGHISWRVSYQGVVVEEADNPGPNGADRRHSMITRLARIGKDFSMAQIANQRLRKRIISLLRHHNERCTIRSRMIRALGQYSEEIIWVDLIITDLYNKLDFSNRRYAASCWRLKGVRLVRLHTYANLTLLSTKRVV